jgi:sulfonate transport system ATP-binding protein
VSAHVSAVTRKFADHVVLDHLDLTVRTQEFVVLLGPSGCGKTTLLRLLGGLDRPDAGTVTVPRNRAIVFQAPRLLPWQRVWQNVTIGLPGPGKASKQTALGVLAEVGLAARAQAWPKTLSGGEAQRVALARALVAEPALVLLDEPFAALDAITRVRMHGLVRDLRRRHAATMLLVTHDVDEAITLADRIVIMRDGRIGAEHEVTARNREHHQELRASLLHDIGISAE